MKTMADNEIIKRLIEVRQTLPERLNSHYTINAIITALENRSKRRSVEDVENIVEQINDVYSYNFDCELNDEKLQVRKILRRNFIDSPVESKQERE